ncbi:genetic competence negative regulator [Microaerobacter geothermalis]|uniref:genetic competence negative regulator n=1 Tax=Microaerobacter geothermalis TaxID=674972 RepID=UPI001F2DCC44|nr:genetic competence negative regulator [Microaerobacter geothermalis]MCF6093509.1 genetic competence negative regulator [Microaerobacter geothermalis]
MKVERLSQDKIRFFLTFDDLVERGIEKEDMWRDVPKIHELFNEMMEQAYYELGFEVYGPVAVEVFALPAQGMVVIVTRGKSESVDREEEDELYEMQVTLEESDLIVYRFSDFEDVIQFAKRIEHYPIDGGSLYHYQNGYYLVFDEIDWPEDQLNNVISILSEFGEASNVTTFVLDEYGQCILNENAIAKICNYF